MKNQLQACVRIGLCCLALSVAEATGGEHGLLELHAKTRVPGTDRFVVAEAFKVTDKIGSRSVAAVGLNFAAPFLGLVETGVSDAQLNSLRYTAGDKALVKASRADTEGAVRFIAHVHRLMELGENGPSHVNGQSNFAYVRSPIEDRLWAVHWYVNDADEWVIGAATVPHPGLDWHSGSRLFCQSDATRLGSVTPMTVHERSSR